MIWGRSISTLSGCGVVPDDILASKVGDWVPVDRCGMYTPTALLLQWSPLRTLYGYAIPFTYYITGRCAFSLWELVLCAKNGVVSMTSGRAEYA